MTKKTTEKSCCGGGSGIPCCKMDAVLTIDNRGQMVLPKDIRQKAGIKAGDKLALICVEKDGKICCLTLVKADILGKSVRVALGPMIEGMPKE